MLLINTGNSSCKDTGKHSHDNDCDGISNNKYQFAAKSAPTSIFSSPVTSPRRLSSVDLFPSIKFSQDFNDILRMPAKTARSPDLSPRRSLGNHSPIHRHTIQGGSHSHHSKHCSRVSPENNHVDAHPLPLPPRASPPPQQSPPQHQSNVMSHHSTENFHSMKGQWQKGKLIGRGSFGSVYQATNLYAENFLFIESNLL
jgi:mitogen-activated protein kinase kinase kinase 3